MASRLRLNVSLSGRMFHPRHTTNCLLLCYNTADLTTSLGHCQLFNKRHHWQEEGGRHDCQLTSDIYKCLVGLNDGQQTEAEVTVTRLSFVSLVSSVRSCRKKLGPWQLL